jgi:Ca2+-binding EF-hand superfamily protein
VEGLPKTVGAALADYVLLFSMQLGMTFSPNESKLLLKHIDSNRSGEISWKEFKRALRPTVQDKDPAFYRGLLDTMCDTIRKSKVQLRRVFRQMDIDGDGAIDLGEFKAGLEALNVLLDTPLDDEQIKKLYSLVDKNSDGA